MEAQLTVEAGPSAGGALSLAPGQSGAIGQGPGAHLVLRDPALGPQHVAAKLEAEGLLLMDLGHPAGSFLNDERLPPRAAVEAFGGDALRVGSHLLRVTLLGRGVRGRRRAPRRLEDPVVPREEFELLRELGSGAAGKVYAARWLPHGGRAVALKVLRDTVQPGSLEFERFLREASTVARLSSPFIVAVYDVRVAAGRAYSVMELVEGPSARDVVAKQGPLPVAHALQIGHQVAQALAAAAEVGVVHRDVKPANIVLTPQGVAKLCDFGIAKDLESTLRTLTASGLGLGTMAYMPPEQVSDAKWVEPSADVYSLGATLYHLLAGRPPFSPTTAQSLAAIVSQPPPDLRTLRPDVPPPVAAQLAAMLAKDPDDRPPLWKLVKQLAALLSG